jgi:hypothetical protein
MDVTIYATATLALYCPRCGQIHMHDINRFVLKQVTRLRLVCSCGQLQATLINGGHQQLFLDIPCVVCQTNHSVCITSKKFWRTNVEKLYCVQENLELGFIGQRRYIEQMLADQRHELESFHDEVEDAGIVDPEVMIGVLNKIHDIAEASGIHCSCGSTQIVAEVAPASLELVCRDCGARLIIPASVPTDLTQLAAVNTIKLVAQPLVCRKH